MAVALVALFFSVTGFGMAAKSMITGADIKDGTVESKDLSKNAVKAKNLAPGSVHGEAIDPTFSPPNKALKRGGDVRPRGVVCANGVIVFAPYYCPTIPREADLQYAQAEDIDDWGTLPGFPPDCGINSFTPMTKLSGSPITPDTDSVDAFNRIEVLGSGRQRLTANVRAVWAPGTGSHRGVLVYREMSGGGDQLLGSAVNAPVPGNQTTQSVNLDFDAFPGDDVYITTAQCGPSLVDLEQLDVEILPKSYAEETPP